MVTSHPGLHLPMPDLGPAAAWAPSLAQAFVGLACDLALVLDEQGCIISVAHGPASGLAEASAGWVGMAWADTVSDDTRAKVNVLLAEVMAQGAARRRELTLRGAGIPVSFAALRLGAAGPTLVVGHDLRAAARLQQRFIVAQRDLEQGYQMAIDSLSAPAAPSPSAVRAVAHLLPAAAELLGLDVVEPLDGTCAPEPPKSAPVKARQRLQARKTRRGLRRR
jgi:hypothetical protein